MQRNSDCVRSAATLQIRNTHAFPDAIVYGIYRVLCNAAYSEREGIAKYIPSRNMLGKEHDIEFGKGISNRVYSSKEYGISVAAVAVMQVKRGRNCSTVAGSGRLQMQSVCNRV